MQVQDPSCWPVLEQNEETEPDIELLNLDPGTQHSCRPAERTSTCRTTNQGDNGALSFGADLPEMKGADANEGARTSKVINHVTAHLESCNSAPAKPQIARNSSADMAISEFGATCLLQKRQTTFSCPPGSPERLIRTAEPTSRPASEEIRITSLIGSSADGARPPGSHHYGHDTSPTCACADVTHGIDIDSAAILRVPTTHAILGQQSDRDESILRDSPAPRAAESLTLVCPMIWPIP